MHSLTYLTLDKDVRQLRQSDVDAFAAQISGGVLSRGRRRATTKRARSGTVPSIAARR